LPAGILSIWVLHQDIFMRAGTFALALSVALSAAPALAHGPQIQISEDTKKIVTRELHLDGPYSTALTSPKLVYVMPLLPLDGVWYSRPNNTPSTTIPGLPAFPSGPGLAYGYDLADGGTQAFAAASVLSVEFADGLKRWNGAAFADAGATQLKSFRGSNASISTPPENFAITSDSVPFDGLSLAPVAAGYGADGAEVHGSLRFALLGDGSSPTSTSPEGVYLLQMQVTSTQSGLSASDPYYFVLNKNGSASDLAAAVQSLGIAPELVQWLVPEPSCAILAVISWLGVVPWRYRRN
jgi:hypothetical protein